MAETIGNPMGQKLTKEEFEKLYCEKSKIIKAQRDLYS